MILEGHRYYANRVLILAAEFRCPKCGRYHVDRGAWAAHPHHTHLCEHCGHEWKERTHPDCHLRGVPPFTFRGRLRAAGHRLADWISSQL